MLEQHRVPLATRDVVGLDTGILGRANVLDECKRLPRDGPGIRNPERNWIISLLFQPAEETARGTVLLAKALNNNSDNPEKFKPFQPETLCRWLDDEIYLGIYEYPKRSTDVINDRRVSQANATEDILRVEGFCEPLVSVERSAEVSAQAEVEMSGPQASSRHSGLLRAFSLALRDRTPLGRHLRNKGLYKLQAINPFAVNTCEFLLNRAICSCDQTYI